MKLNKKKLLAARTLNVGKDRIVFLNEGINEIKSAITKQDIRDLVKGGAIKIKNVKGRKGVEKRKRKRGSGKIKKKINIRKRSYVIMTRKFRKYIKNLKDSDRIDKEKYYNIRKKIKNREFSNLAQLKDFLKSA